MQNKDIIIMGHRGCGALYPECTLLAFEAGIDLGVDAVEFDVHMSADGVPVVCCDGNIFRTCGVDRRIKDMTLDEIKSYDAGYQKRFGDRFMGQGITIPTLDEVVSFCKAKKPDILFGAELKAYGEANTDTIAEVFIKHDMLAQTMFLAYEAPLARQAKTKYGATVLGNPDFMMKRCFEGVYEYYDYMGLSMSIVRSELLAFYAAKGIPLHMWCPDTEADVEYCVMHEAKMLTANDPTAAIKFLRG